MKYYPGRLSKPFKSVLLFALIFGAALLLILYSLGVIRFSFLDPYRELLDAEGGENRAAAPETDDPFDPFSSFAGTIQLPNRNQGEDAVTDRETSPQNDQHGEAVPAQPNASGDPHASEMAEQGSHEPPADVKNVYSASRLPDERSKISTVSSLLDAGKQFSPSDKPYVPGVTILGKLTFDFQLPEFYSDRERQVTDYRIEPINPADADSELKATPFEHSEAAPAVELYMGYVLLEHGDKTIILSKDGVPLCSYPAGRYLPAYARDREDRPLFCRKGENGAQLFFTLSEDGKSFLYSDYKPSKDGRGLSFDYPARYGRPDDGSPYPDLDEKTKLSGYRFPDPEGVTGNAYAAASLLTPYQYITAHPFVDGAATVTAGEPVCTYGYVDRYNLPLFPRSEYSGGWIQTFGNPDGSYQNPSGLRPVNLFVIGTDGKPLFPPGRMYTNEFDRRVFEAYKAPYTTGIEAIGSFYFDDGLIRVRKQIIDFWRYFLRVSYNGSEIKVVDEYDTLLYKDGTEFEIPVGFTLEGYSESMLLLKREGCYGFLSNTGEWIAQPIYTDAGPFIDGLAPLQTADGRWGLIDKEGKIVLPFTYDSISQVSSGLIACYREENGWSILRFME